jgi:hypothetical protein
MSNPYTPPTDLPHADSFDEAEIETHALQRATRVLRWLVVAEILLSIASGIVSLATVNLLPPELRAYEQATFEADLTSKDLILLGVALVLLSLIVVSSIGLLVFWRPARLLYLVRIIAGIAIAPFAGPYVDAGWGDSLEGAAILVSGVILPLIYYPPLSQLFEQRRPSV